MPKAFDDGMIQESCKEAGTIPFYHEHFSSPRLPRGEILEVTIYMGPTYGRMITIVTERAYTVPEPVYVRH